MSCKNINIKLCPACLKGDVINCFTESFRIDLANGNVKHNIRQLIYSGLYKVVPAAQIYYDAAIEHYYPKHLTMFNNLKLLI